MDYKEIFVTDQVSCLPDLVSKLSSSDRVGKLNDRQITNHEIALTEFRNSVKETNETAEKKLKAVTKEKLKTINDNLFKISSMHIHAIEVQENFVSVEQFHDIWDEIKNEVKETLEEITLMEQYIIETIEFNRIENIKALTTLYFDEIKSNGIWDDLKLNRFLNNEFKLYNMELIKNFRKYSAATSNIKVFVIIKMVDYRKQWEKLLLTWRDFLVDKNLAEVKEIVQSDEYMRSAQIEIWREEIFLSFKEDDETILRMYSKIIEGLPYNQENMISFSNKIEEILKKKEVNKEKYLEKARVYNGTLIEKLEKKLLNIKLFLFKEASCSEEQFLKTFSKYTGDGAESFEMVSKQILISDCHELNKNLKTMNNVHSIMMRFLYSIYEVWSENAEKVKSLREKLFDELQTCREMYESDKKLLEFAIDRIANKVPFVACTTRLDKSFDKVKIKLKAIEQNSEDLHSELMNLIMAYPKTCENQIKGYESQILWQIGLLISKPKSQLFSDPEVESYEKLDPYFVSVDGQAYDRLDDIPALCYNPGINDIIHDVHETCEKLYASTCKIIVDHIGRNEKNHTEIFNVLVSKLKNEMYAEKKLREDIHQPRLGLISEDFLNRKNKLDKFRECFDQFYESSVEFESQMGVIEDDLTNKTDDVITQIEVEIDRSLNKQLKTFKSKALINNNMKFESMFMEFEKKLPSLVKSSLSKIDKDSKSMRIKEEEFFDYASCGNFDFTEKSKYYHEFLEIKERMKLASIQCKRTIKQIEIAKSKKISGFYQNYKTHFKHCLVDLYFLEFKSMLLTNIRTKIRIATSYGEKDLCDAKILCKQIQQSCIELDNCHSKTIISKVLKHKNDFINVFGKLKNFINFLNYRCSDVTFPAQNSFAKLNEKYSKFVDDNASIGDTIDFTKDIMQLTSNSNQYNPSFLSGSETNDSSDINWVADRSDVEKKYITGYLTCIYGVGANCFDVPNHPWANACATLVSNNSYWLSKNRDGMQALKDLQDKKQTSTTKSQTTCGNNVNTETNSSSKMKYISNKIRNLIIPTVQSNLQEKKSQKNSEKNSVDSLTKSYDSGSKNITSENKKQLIPQSTMDSGVGDMNPTKKMSILPAINASLRSPSRNNSVNQMNLRKVMNLNKTVEYLTQEQNRKRRSTYFQPDRKLPVYDFLIMDEKELNKFVFETAVFFEIPTRKYNVDDVCQNIFSIVEKVKCYLLHLQEDFIVTCIIFYRQKHISIKYTHLMHANSDSEIDNFVSQLQLYLESVHNDCEKNITKVKSILNKLYDIFEVSSAKIFSNLFSEMKQSFIEFYNSQVIEYQEMFHGNRSVKEKLNSSLRPSYCHPNHNETLKRICEDEKQKRINDKLKSHFNYSIDMLNEMLCDFESKIKCISDNLQEIIKDAIQIRDIRKMDSRHANMYEVKKMLRYNLVTTISNVSNLDSQNDVITKNSKLKSTKDRLMQAVLNDRNIVVRDFKNLHKSKTDDFQKLHLSSCAEEEDWIIMWQSSVRNLEGLVNNEI